MHVVSEKMRGRKGQKPAVLACILLSCAVMTLGLGPNQFAKFKSFSANKPPEARKLEGHEKASLTEFFNAVRGALPFTVTTTADNGSNTSPTSSCFASFARPTLLYID